jgi:hypothetical protein
VRIEYIGVNDRQVGTGTLHKVHAFWTAGRDDDGAVKRAASAAVRKVVGKGGSVTFSSWEVGTYKHPHLDAVILVRVLNDAQVTARRELQSRRYTQCDGTDTGGFRCTDTPGEVVLVKDTGSELALCYGCRTNLPKGGYQVRHWIQSDGRVQIN